MGIHSSQNLLHLHRDTVLARASLSCLNPMGMGRVQGRGEFQFVCFSNELWGQELACSCSVILFLSEPTFFFFLLSIFVLCLLRPHPSKCSCYETQRESQMAVFGPQRIVCPLLMRDQCGGVNDKFTSSAWKGWRGHSVGKRI